MKRGRQALDRNIHRAHARQPARVDETEHGKQQRERRNRERAVRPEPGHRLLEGKKQSDDRKDDQGQIAQQRLHEQRREHAHRDRARPRKPVGVAIVSNYLVARDK